MKASFVTFCIVLASLFLVPKLQAQVAHQVIVANGGVFGPANIVKIGAWDLNSGNYMVIDSFPGRSVQHVLIHDRSAIICADSVLVRYNLDNLQRVAMVIIPGVRQSAVYQDKVIVAKGYGAVGQYLEVRNLSDLSPDYSVSGLAGECEGIVVVEDTAFVAVPIGFGSNTGRIAVVDLASHTLNRQVDLDTNGRIIRNMYLRDGRIFSVNQIGYFSPYGIVSEYEIASRALVHHRVDLPVSQGAGIFAGKVYAAFGAGLGAWEIQSATVTDTNICPGYWAAMAMDTLDQRFYVTETDYATYGKLYAYDWNGQRVDSVNIGVSPEAIAVDNQNATASRPVTDRVYSLKAYPQPFADALHVDLRSLPSPAERIALIDLTGKVILEKNVVGNTVVDLETNGISSGFHLLKVYGKDRVWTTKVLKVQD